mgnify:CR=1 FL=1
MRKLSKICLNLDKNLDRNIPDTILKTIIFEFSYSSFRIVWWRLLDIGPRQLVLYLQVFSVITLLTHLYRRTTVQPKKAKGLEINKPFDTAAEPFFCCRNFVYTVLLIIKHPINCKFFSSLMWPSNSFAWIHVSYSCRDTNWVTEFASTMNWEWSSCRIPCCEWWAIFS